MPRLTTASLEQRIAALHLLLAVKAQSNAVQAAYHREKWEALVREIMDRDKTNTTSRASEKGRAAWPLVLGELRDTNVVTQAHKWARAGYLDRPDSDFRVNTYVVALMRAGQFDEALNDEALRKLDLAIDLYERTRDPLDRGKARLGRPLHWVVRALILLRQCTKKNDQAKHHVLRENADDFLNAARESLNMQAPQSQVTWRATWEKLDLEVLIAEAESKLGLKPSP